ncbi:hypothetical protein R1T08_16930 [Streptomyces sp. SBC-4]|nr:hypothetical protein [Streptomyces sp. SBC-4]MDV5145846.1 hypothetical protein [Streptomyces sp. SBC-4]
MKFAVLCAVLAVTAGLAVVFVVGDESGGEPGISFAHGSDSYPNHTATDWVTYADHVVVVTPAEEKDQKIPAEDRERGEGIVLRELKLRVDKVLWSRAKASQPAPEVVDWLAWGWSFKDGDTGKRTKMASEGSPRIEMGHSYIIAITWEEALCDEGDAPVPAHWNGLGSAGVIPFDSAMLGQGESEGSVFTAAQAREQAAPPASDTSLEAKVRGKGVTELVAELKSASPTERKRFRPVSPCK